MDRLVVVERGSAGQEEQQGEKQEQKQGEKQEQKQEQQQQMRQQKELEEELGHWGASVAAYRRPTGGGS